MKKHCNSLCEAKKYVFIAFKLYIVYADEKNEVQESTVNCVSGKTTFSPGLKAGIPR